ncbi:MAG: tyrosinase family protein [Planctomycetia bacterium]
MNVRKNQASLTTGEKTAFVNAVLKLKTTVPSQIGLTNRYDDYVQIHMDSMMLPDGSDRVPGWAHRGPAFGPWHRALLRNLELDLQDAAGDPNLSLPYWDWTVNQSPDAVVGSPWTDDFMGQMDPTTDVVKTGPFRQGVWVLNVRQMGISDTMLRRALGRSVFQTTGTTAATLPTPTNVGNALLETPYDSPAWSVGAAPSFRDRIEGWHGPGSIHNRVHLWVGGSMLPSTSPNDPIFFLHHCNIDRLWAQWQHPSGLPSRNYVPIAGTVGAPDGHRLTDAMKPWGGAVTVQSATDHHAMQYKYDDEPGVPHPLALPHRLAFPKWQHVPQKYEHQHHPMQMFMFDLSPEDKAAGGHARNQ